MQETGQSKKAPLAKTTLKGRSASPTQQQTGQAKGFSTPVKETKQLRDGKEPGSILAPRKGLTATTTKEYEKAFPTLFGAVDALTKTQLKKKANKTVLQRMPGTNKQDYIRAFLETFAKRDEKSAAQGLQPMSKLRQSLTSPANSRLDEQPDKVAEEWANLLFYYSDDTETDFKIDPVSCNLLLESPEGLTIKQMKAKVAQMDLDCPKNSADHKLLRLGLVRTAARRAANNLYDMSGDGFASVKMNFGDMKELRGLLDKEGKDKLDKWMANEETALKLRFQWMRAVRSYYIDTTKQKLKKEMDTAEDSKK